MAKTVTTGQSTIQGRRADDGPDAGTLINLPVPG
ncbi:MAG: hypothetical protein QOF58_2803 [Pseudonocardiales bacterium]|nr:hypothetical protein [Pseudonocardiales bacterium]